MCLLIYLGLFLIQSLYRDHVCQKFIKKMSLVFWSEVHLYQSNFLQNPYFRIEVIEVFRCFLLGEFAFEIY